MKTTNDVLLELQKAKAANAARFGDLRAYVAHLQVLNKKAHPGGVVTPPATA